MCHQYPDWKDGLFLLALAKSWLLALGATSVPGSKSPVNGTINSLSKERRVAEGSDQPNQSMRWNPTTQGLHSPGCLFLPSLPIINFSIRSGENSCIKDLLSHPLIKKCFTGKEILSLTVAYLQFGDCLLGQSEVVFFSCAGFRCQEKTFG